ncbi:MAG: hypothetical protein IT384_20430 [Deltaproteobacteria bacterium]|nr:hypothetical protein [Deltaproteobacteria bacterium]
MASPNVHQVTGKGGGVDPATQFALNARANVLRTALTEAGLDPKLQPKDLDKATREALEEILQQFKAQKPTDADEAAALAKLAAVLAPKSARAAKAPSAPKGNFSTQLTDQVRSSPFSKSSVKGQVGFTLSPSLQSVPIAGGKTQPHLVGEMYRRLGIDPQNVPEPIAQATMGLISDRKFNLDRDQGLLWNALLPLSAKGAASSVAGANKAQATTPVNGSAGQNGAPAATKEDLGKVANGDQAGKPTQANWLNTLTGNLAAGRKDSQKGVSKAVDEFIADAKLGEVSPADRKKLEELFAQVGKDAFVDGQLRPGKMISNAFMQLAAGAGTPEAKQGAAIGTELQKQLDLAKASGALPQEVMGQVDAAMLHAALPGIMLAAAQAKLGRKIDNPAAALGSMSMWLESLTNANGIAGPGPAGSINETPNVKGAQAGTPDRLQRAAGAYLQFVQAATAKVAPSLAGAAKDANEAFKAGRLGEAKEKLLEMERKLISGEAEVTPGAEGAMVSKAGLQSAVLKAGQAIAALGVARSAQPGAAPGKITPAVQAAAKKAFEELRVLDPSIKADSKQGKELLAALEEVYSRGAATPQDLVRNAFQHIQDKSGLDMSQSAAMIVNQLEQFGHMPGMADRARQMALGAVAKYTLNPSGFTQEYQAYAQQLASMGGDPRHIGGGAPVVGAAPQALNGLTGAQRATVGWSILNDPSLSFEDKLFLFMMYMVQFAEQDEMKKMEEINELDRREELKNRNLAKLNGQTDKLANDRKTATNEVSAAQSQLDQLKRDKAPDDKIQEATKKLEGASQRQEQARALEQQNKDAITTLKAQEAPTQADGKPAPSRDMLQMELRRLEQWRGMLMDMTRQILEERNRRIRQIWQQ